jgi:hypothetical protein
MASTRFMISASGALSEPAMAASARLRGRRLKTIFGAAPG